MESTTESKLSCQGDNGGADKDSVLLKWQSGGSFRECDLRQGEIERSSKQASKQASIHQQNHICNEQYIQEDLTQHPNEGT